MMREIRNVGFIGLGIMGGAFAGNLLKGGLSVKGYDPFAPACDSARSAGATIVDSPAQVAEGSELVALMVPDVPEIEASLEGEHGVLSSAGDGRLLMVMSTIDPGAVTRLAGRVAEAGWRYVDCPVGRTADDARRGESTFMLGGAPEDKERVRPVLDAIGTGVIDCGDVGHGMMVKVVNNFMSTAGALLVAEALRLAEAGGVSANTVLEVVNGTVASNGHSRTHYPAKVLNGDLSPGFAIKHARKDCRIARTVMDRHGLPNFIAPVVVNAFEQAVEGGHGDNDWSDMYNVVRELRREP